MSRSQDTVIDDDEETCPLCIEEFDLSDKNFRPCPCGYQICQFCFNSLKTTYEKSTCPNCRRPYDEKTIQYKIPTAEEFKLDQMNKNKKQAAAKRKETEKREVENSSRRNLAGVRVKQQNLVYVIGLIPQMKDEQALLQTLRGPEYFGQYGEIDKIVVSKPKPGAVNQGVGVYITYARKEDAALCIATVDGTLNGDRVLRAQFGTTKYCSAFLRGETCTNKTCSFLHETGEDGQSTSLQNEPHGAKAAARSGAVSQASQISQMSVPPRPLSASQPVAQPVARPPSKERGTSRKSSHDSSALPSTASWAAANAPVGRARRASQTNSRATPSPQMGPAALEDHKTDDAKAKDVLPTHPAASTAAKKPSPKVDPVAAEPPAPSPSRDPVQEQYESVLRRIMPDYRFVFDDACLSPEVRARMDDIPPFIDPYGGAKRRAKRAREEAERAKFEAEAKAKLEAQALSTAEDALDEDPAVTAGSLALGGEPEEDPRSSSGRGAIGRPAQSVADQFAAMNLANRSLTPQQRQQVAFLNAGSAQQTPTSRSGTQNTAFEMSDFDRRGPQYSQAQFEQISSHQRHGSRYFNTDTKSAGATRFPAQQQTFYSSGVQGPPPGLPTAGTPPVSGGGMFAHGQNFTNPGFGTAKDANTEIFARNRSGTGSNVDTKRGGVEHLADPSIVQARVHQGTAATGQGLFGGNQVDEQNFPPLPARSEVPALGLHSRVSSFHSFQSSSMRSSTPKVPPGFELTHSHPAPHLRPGSPGRGTPTSPSPSRTISAASTTVVPAVPTIPLAQRTTSAGPLALEKRNDKAGVAEPATGGPQGESPQRGEASGAHAGASKSTLVRSKPVDLKNDVLEILASEKTKTSSQVSQGKGAGKASGSTSESFDLAAASTPAAAVPRAASARGKAPEKSLPPALDTGMVGTPTSVESRSSTPADSAVVDATKVAGARPRTLRVTTGMASKPVEPVTPSAASEKFGGILAASSAKKSGSRRPSLSSAQYSRPSTPAMSDRPMSQPASRASTPPLSIIGSAPERVKSKAQQKKERKEKAKKATETGETPTSAAPSTPAVEEVAPVIARQKKQKKRGETSTSVSLGDGRKAAPSPDPSPLAAPKEPQPPKQPEQKAAAAPSPSPATNDAEHAPVAPAPPENDQKPDEPAPSVATGDAVAKVDERARAPYTVKELYDDIGRIGVKTNARRPAQQLLNEHLAAMPKIISSMIQSDDLAKDHPWLNPPNFNSPAYRLPPDSRRGQEYLDGNGYSASDAFGYIYLPLKEKQALKEGHAVSVADAGDRKEDLLKRCLVTPNGWVLRHLSADESERLLELEERRQMFVDEFGDIGTMTGLGAVEPNDFTNLGGGMERLSRHGERHGVVWVVGDGEEANDDDDDFDEFDDDEEVGVSDDDDEFQDAPDGVSMPGAWDVPQSGGKTTDAEPAQFRPTLTGLGPHSRSTAVPGTTTARPASPGAPLSQARQASVNVRELDADALQRRVADKQKELEVARKEMDRIEKLWNKKAKDMARWREGLLKA